ncbi:FAD/NAD(P)-binding protein [Novosphingobium sp. Leaf2]|uniref:FAD/NAD(P)-binding protein n=1 Tax=Novosphingobium sp. Leaf2 TaxID=1735670 RepID=UPI0006F25080|nr:FAD/NAD(P)-binding protein [Novosphingobium sp. Leaf2]KQM19005.1 FAD-dependent oxidoreductase [Novosphingobium sp. Leaf2]
MPSTPSRETLPVAVVGGGFSGTLLTINLLRHGARVVLIERAVTQMATGLAFGTARPEHLLNVRAANMSAFPDDLGHFVRWLGVSGSDAVNRFVPRRIYGEYLRDLLDETLAAADGRGAVKAGEATAARFEDERVVLTLDGSEELACRTVVLALGNFPPSLHPALSDLPPEICFTNPWQAAGYPRLDAVNEVLLLGSGLTAIDGVLSLERAGYRGRYTALSRRGLKPRSHALSGPSVERVAAPEARGSQLLQQVRARASQVEWRVAVDELRPHTQNIWRRHDHAGQARFLRHLRPYWDVHRHRLAPEIGEQIAALEREGRLRFVAGKLVSATPENGPENGSARVIWRPRGTDDRDSVQVGLIVTCTGPDGDLTHASDPLIRDLLQQRRVRADAHRLGLDVSHTGNVLDAWGERQDDLFAVGPITKGEAWEIVAVPDIRRQVWDLARYLTNAHWVEGEGL